MKISPPVYFDHYYYGRNTTTFSKTSQQGCIVGIVSVLIYDFTRAPVSSERLTRDRSFMIHARLVFLLRRSLIRHASLFHLLQFLLLAIHVPTYQTRQSYAGQEVKRRLGTH